MPCQASKPRSYARRDLHVYLMTPHPDHHDLERWDPCGSFVNAITQI